MESEKCNQPSSPSRAGRNTRLKDLFHFPLLKRNMISWIDNTNFYLCKLCTCTIIGKYEAYEHINTCFHKQNLEDRLKDGDNIEIELDSLDDFEEYFYCKECDIYTKNGALMIQCHLLFHLYKMLPRSYTDIFQYSCINKKHHLKCLLCNVLMHSTEMLANHLKNIEHIQNIDLLHNIECKWLPHIDWNRLDLETMEKENQLMPFSFKGQNYMQIKSKNSKSAIWIDLHNRQSERRFDREISSSEKLEIEKNFNMSYKYDFYVCHLCDQKFYSLDLILKHHNNWKHKLFLFIVNDPYCSFLQTMHYFKFIQQLPLKVEEKLKRDEEVETLADDKIKNTLYQEEVKKFGCEYITMCIEKNNRNIYSIKDSEIYLLNKGMSLIFTCTGHKVCIPCNYKFRNSAEHMLEHLQCSIHLRNLRKLEKFPKGHKDKRNFLELAYSCIVADDISKGGVQHLKCFACETFIRNINHDIEDHLKSNGHRQKIKSIKGRTAYFLRNNTYISEIPKEIWYYTERFFCEVCNLRYNREICFAIHLGESEHLEKIKGNELNHSINICFVCSTCWYGVPSYTKHSYSSHHHAHFKRNFQPFMNKYTKDLLKNFDRESNSIATNSEGQNRKDELFLLQSIEETVKPVYRSAKAYAFGSRLAGLSFSSSDVDIFLDCENIYYSLGSQERSQKYVQKVLDDCIEKEKEIWKVNNCRLKARVPIIKLTHLPTNLECDISFLSGLGVEKSKLIRSYVIANPTCKKFILYLKKWFQSCQLYGSYAISGYAVTWLAIFYLQVSKLVPSVHEVLSQNKKHEFVEGWPCAFSNQILLKDTRITLISIVRGFFKYYAEFDFCDKVACPFLGKVMKKQAFVVINDLPPEMHSYKERMKITETEYFRYDSPMVIQDPVDLSQNITKAVTKSRKRYFRYLCSVSSKILK